MGSLWGTCLQRGTGGGLMNGQGVSTWYIGWCGKLQVINIRTLSMLWERRHLSPQIDHINYKQKIEMMHIKIHLTAVSFHHKSVMLGKRWGRGFLKYDLICVKFESIYILKSLNFRGHYFFEMRRIMM